MVWVLVYLVLFDLLCLFGDLNVFDGLWFAVLLVVGLLVGVAVLVGDVVVGDCV